MKGFRIVCGSCRSSPCVCATLRLIAAIKLQKALEEEEEERKKRELIQRIELAIRQKEMEEVLKLRFLLEALRLQADDSPPSSPPRPSLRTGSSQHTSSSYSGVTPPPATKKTSNQARTTSSSTHTTPTSGPYASGSRPSPSPYASSSNSNPNAPPTTPSSTPSSRGSSKPTTGASAAAPSSSSSSSSKNTDPDYATIEEDFYRKWTTDKEKVRIIQMFGIKKASRQSAYNAIRDSMIDNTERILYHGTRHSCGTLDCKSCSACGIVKDGFQHHKTRTSSRLRFGPGFYFSTQSNAAHSYTRLKDSDGHRCIIVCKVALGRSLQFQESQWEPIELSDKFHSIHGAASDRGDLTNDEFVVYDSDQVLPIAVICYSYSLDSLLPPSLVSTHPTDPNNPKSKTSTMGRAAPAAPSQPFTHRHPLSYTRARRDQDDSFTCAVCQTARETGSWHCRLCSYDECQGCFWRNSGLHRQPEAHQHTLKYIDSGTFECFLCFHRHQGAWMFCSICQWYECLDCYPKNSGLGARCGHNKNYVHRGNFKCSLCKKSEYGSSHYCESCNWDVCQSCNIKMP